MRDTARWRSISRVSCRGHRWWKIFVFLLLLGAGIEFAQYFMHVGREGDVRDVLANVAGAALGLLLARLGLARWPEGGAGC